MELDPEPQGRSGEGPARQREDGVVDRPLRAPLHAVDKAEGRGEARLLPDLFGQEEGGEARRSRLGLGRRSDTPALARCRDGKIGTYVRIE